MRESIEQMLGWSRQTGFHQWVFVVLAFAVALTALSLVRRALWKRFERWAETTSATWDDLLLSQIKGPVRALMVLIAIWISGQLVPAQVRNHPASSLGSKIALILAVLWFFERLVSFLFKPGAISPQATGIMRTLQSMSSSSRVLLLTLARILIISIAALVVLDTAGISITPILASLGVGSIAIALALQDTLSNFFSGLYLLADRPIRIGDLVELEGGVRGEVIAIGWRSTRLQLPSNTTAVIPNSKVASARVTNYNLPEAETQFAVDVSVDYASDLAAVERITIEVAKEVLARVEGGIATFEPLVRYNAFGDNGIAFAVILRARNFGDSFLIKHEFIKALHRRYNQEGIAIPYPQTVVHMAKA